MGKSLVIVESPAKARTINRYLGKDYIVKSSVGHIRDLPTSGSGKPVDPKARARTAAETRKLSPEKKAAERARRARASLIQRMGINPAKDWEAHYEILPRKEKVVEELRREARRADRIYLATDMDREGEAIAWHLQEAIGGDKDRFLRVVFNEITRSAIEAAFEKPGRLDLDRVNAQQARRFLDRVVGYEVSPLLWDKVARGLSAGRVQSVAVRLIVEREREIRAFVPEEYWEAFADLIRPADQPAAADAGVRFQVFRDNGEAFRPTSAEQSEEAMGRLRERAGDFRVASRDDKPTSSRPSAPFTTSTLQQAASTRMGFSVRKTMTLAQRLYEAGFITYMRTDSTNLAADAVTAVRGFIGEHYGETYVPDKPNTFSNSDQAQEAHEAIRPSDVEVGVDNLGRLEPDARRLYDLIWRRFVACQMPPARYTSSTMVVAAGEFELRIRGRILRFDGHTRVQPPAPQRDEDQALPDFEIGEKLALIKLEPIQHFTKPPARFGEASLVRELEKRGIGRPSTYASIISTIQDRGYVTLRNRRFHAERIGELVTERLVESFENLLDYGFTAQLEGELDQVADGKLSWKGVLNEFYRDFSGKLKVARAADSGMRRNEPTDTDIECPDCARAMQIRTGSTGVFLGCSGYGLPAAERCTRTLNLIPGDEVADVDADADAESRILRAKRRCDTCGAAMNGYLVDEKRKLHICGNNPDCAGFALEHGEYRIRGYDGPVVECDKCGANMELKSGRFGKYFGCTGDDCRNTRKLLRNGEAAPPRADPVPMPELKCVKVDDTYVLRDGAAGLFLAASQFPRNRETRAPKVLELQPHANELDAKFRYLLSAPTVDHDGNLAVLKFTRKTREQYVATEVDGKATGWRALYQGGHWVEELPTAASPGNGKAGKKGRTGRTGKAGKTGKTSKTGSGKRSAAGRTIGKTPPRSGAKT